MATRQEIEAASTTLADYMRSKSEKNWLRWIEVFIKTPLTSMEYTKVREIAKEMAHRHESSPVLKSMK